MLSILLYGAETWTFYRKHINQLDAFHMRCLRVICGIKWDDRVRNSTILKRCNIAGIETLQAKIQLRWAGHVVRMNENRLPKKILYGQLPNAKRSIGRPLLRYKDKLKDNLKRLDIDLSAWEDLASDRKE